MREKGLRVPDYDQIGGAVPIVKNPARVVASTNRDAVFTEAQASRGQQVYRRSCAVCHLDNLAGDAVSPSLVGDAFAARYGSSTIYDMVTAIRESMPQNAPDSLGDQAYVDLVAFLLKANGRRAGAVELLTDPAELQKIAIH
jgi:mono/diheme cytochrome c family protein